MRTRLYAFIVWPSVDPMSAGMQPFESKSGRYVCLANGEIYNHKELTAKLRSVTPYKPQSHSDCEVIVHLFEHLLSMNKTDVKALSKLCQLMDGEFAFIIYDLVEQVIYCGTDELSCRPLFLACARGSTQICLASEQKVFVDLFDGQYDVKRLEAGHCYRFPVRPMHTMSVLLEGGRKYFDMSSIPVLDVETITYDTAADKLVDLLRQNIIKKLNPEREYAFLLSGGLDSSCICGIAAAHLKTYGKRLRTFTCGFSADAPDVVAARLVASHIDSIHTEVIVPFAEVLKDESFIREVIWALESWCQTTVRASVPMKLVMRYIRRRHPEIAVVYSGEVADELLQGYLYNLQCPSPTDGREDAIKRLTDILYSDGLRSDRIPSSESFETRYPFFGKELLTFVLSLPCNYTDPTSPFNDKIEKKLLRHGLARSPVKYIPDTIIWRTKHAFSDATSVKSSWKDAVKAHAAKYVTESRFARRQLLYPHGTPQTIEDMYYREIFDELFTPKYSPQSSEVAAKCIPFKWMPSWTDPSITDASATVLPCFKEDKL